MKSINKILITLFGISFHLVCLSQTNDYPTTWQNATCDAGNNTTLFAYKNCTDYAAWRMNRDHNNPSSTSNLLFVRDMFGTGNSGGCSPTGSTQRLSNACRWDNVLAANGYFVSNVPTPGAIAQYNAYEGNGVGVNGHVAYVESVSTTGNGSYSVILSQYNGGDCNWTTSTKSITPTSTYPRFIRFNRFEMVGGQSYTVVQGQILTVSVTVKNNFGSSVNNVKFRCALYSSNNEFLGEIGTTTKSFSTTGSQQTLTFSKQILSCPGNYKIWIESKLSGASSNTPWVIIHKPNASSTMSLSITNPASNNEYTSAQILTVSSSWVYSFGSTCYGTQSSSPSAVGISCSTSNINDIWFKFTPAVAGYYTVNTTSSGYTLSDAVMAIYTSTNSSGTSLVYNTCNDNQTSTNYMPKSSFYVSNNYPVYIRVWGKNGGKGCFGICVRTGQNISSENSSNKNEEEYMITENSENDFSNYSLNDRVNIFPNPANEIINLHIDVNNSETKFNVDLYNSTGELLFSKHINVGATNTLRQTIDVNSFSKGVYFINIRNDTETTFRRVLIE